MKREVVVSVGASCLTLAACAGVVNRPEEVRVRVEDNVGGASAGQISPAGEAVRVQVAEFATDCQLQQFLIGPRPAEGRGVEAQGSEVRDVRAPDEVRGGKAILSVFRPGDWVVRAQYVHTVLTDIGRETEPEGEAPAWGEGDLVIGRPLGGGYRFDHVEFASHVTGPGGASARVARRPNLNAQETTTTVHWYYDKYSKVDFRWKLYARGPCDTRP
jgi:hypothetical protein